MKSPIAARPYREPPHLPQYLKTETATCVLSTGDARATPITLWKYKRNKLLKTYCNNQNAVDLKRVKAHIEVGSKRFEEQQVSENIANRGR